MADIAAIDPALADEAVTRDAFYSGRLMLTQPRRGHRSGTDAILLAAAVPRDFEGMVLDVGAGVGAAGLGVAIAACKARVTLVERDPALARLAVENIAGARLGDRVDLALCDLFEPSSHGALAGAADLVLTNPPFYEPARARSSPVEKRRTAHILDAHVTLTDWVRACLDLLGPKGELVVVHAAGAVPEILAALDRRAGGCVLKPIHPRPDATAHRVLVRARKGSRAPFAIAAPLVLHAADGGFTPNADRLHRGESALAW